MIEVEELMDSHLLLIGTVVFIRMKATEIFLFYSMYSSIFLKNRPIFMNVIFVMLSIK